MFRLQTRRASRQSARAATGLILASAVAAFIPSHVDAQTRLQAGTLACSGEGGWGAIITSKKDFRCAFTSSDGVVRGEYTGQIRKVGIDIGMTGQTALMWLVFGPEGKTGNDYAPGSLEGSYVGVGADAAVGMGLGANALAGGGPNSFALQPVSVQVQTGLSIAAGVQTLDLQYVGPLN